MTANATPKEAMAPVLVAALVDRIETPTRYAAVRDAIAALVVAELETVGKAWPLGCQCHTCAPLKARLAEWRAGRIER